MLVTETACARNGDTLSPFLHPPRSGPNYGATCEHTVSEDGSTCGPSMKKCCPVGWLAILCEDIFLTLRCARQARRVQSCSYVVATGTKVLHGQGLPGAWRSRHVRRAGSRRGHNDACAGRRRQTRLAWWAADPRRSGGSLGAGMKGVRSDKICHSRFLRRRSDP